MFRFFGTFFEKVLEDFGKRRRKRRPGAISAPYGAPTEPRCVSAFGNAPSLPPLGFCPPSGRRGSTHSPRRYDFTRQHASARDAIAETVQPRSVSTLRRECSTRATAFYRPPFHCGRYKAMKQGTASHIHLNIPEPGNRESGETETDLPYSYNVDMREAQIHYGRSAYDQVQRDSAVAQHESQPSEHRSQLRCLEEDRKQGLESRT